MADLINDEKNEGRRLQAPLTRRQIAARKRRLAALLSELDAMPTVDHRSADEILGYNKDGHFD